ncbi:MAG: histidinol-phosphate transaminase [Gammaproteobacteria bacterium]|nr:histidinol-phosphate transaminase [Gammaproteobacteria bacterium]
MQVNNPDNTNHTNSNFALPYTNNLALYIPGKPIETLAREKNLSKIIKLASNENPFGPSPLVKQAIIDTISQVSLYPDPDQYLLKQKLANLYNINTNQLAIGNGSDELIRLIMQAFVSKENNVIAPKYSFSSYYINSQLVEAKYIVSDIHENNSWQNNLENILANINKNTKLICIANPNNPTGSYLAPDLICEFIKKVPENILILLDEAYFEYIKYNSTSRDYPYYQDYSLDLINQYNNIISLRTFSKAYGLAGLRVGYAIANPDLITVINKLKQPFNVNRIAQIAATAALLDQKYIEKIVAINNQEREKLCQILNGLHIDYMPSETNFITIYNIDAQKLYNQLLDLGIIVRPVNNYGLNNHLRISIGTPEENNFLIANLTRLINLS